MGTYIYSKDYYKNYSYSIDTELKDGEWESSLESYNDDISPICVYNKNKISAIKQLKKLIRQYIDDGKGLELQLKEYPIYYEYPDTILKTVKDGFVYNIADSDCFEGILKYGFIPNAKTDQETYEGSLLIDRYKPKNIKNFYRSASTYSYPELDNYNFSRDRYNVDLWVMNISNLNKDKIRLGSQGIAGFCNCYYSNFNEEEDVVKAKQYEKYMKDQRSGALLMAKRYWKYSYSLDEYLQNKHLKTNKQWGIDELLYCGFIPPQQIEYIGGWNKEGEFTIVNGFSKYVQDIIPDYRKIINQYQIHSKITW